jgi:hypothetical protein
VRALSAAEIEALGAQSLLLLVARKPDKTAHHPD